MAVVRAYYRSFGRLETMTFYARFGAPPTIADCKNLTRAYGLWESAFPFPPVGYSLLRSADSHFVDCRAWSVDPGSSATHISGAFDRSGAVPSFVSAHLPTTLCPMVYWLTSPKRRYRGRTYAVGLTENFNRFTGDTEVINGLYADALVTQMNELRQFFQLEAGAVQVLIERQAFGLQFAVAPSFAVTGCTAGDRLMGAQRRRTRQRAEASPS